MQDLSLQNYIVMRDSVRDPNFLLQKKLERRIQKLYPQKFMPLYSMVTFSHVPYKEALIKGVQQDKQLKN